MRRNCLLNSILCMHKQAAGACWYLLGIQRAAKCLKEQCGKTNGCGLRILSCKEPIYYGSTNLVRDRARLAWAGNREARSTCLDGPDKYNYGAYKWTVQLVTNDNRLEKILFPIFWGLMTLRYPHFLFPWPTTWFCMMNKSSILLKVSSCLFISVSWVTSMYCDHAVVISKKLDAKGRPLLCLCIFGA